MSFIPAGGFPPQRGVPGIIRLGKKRKHTRSAEDYSSNNHFGSLVYSMVWVSGGEATGMETGRIELKTVVMAVITIVVLESGGGTFLFFFPHISGLVVLTGLRILEIVSLVLVVHGFGQGLFAVGLARDQLRGGLLQGLCWSFVFGLVALAGSVLLFIAGINPFDLLHVSLPDTMEARVLFFITAGIIGPLAEEIFFRGILYGFFRQWGVWISLSVTTLLFVVMHPPGAAVPVPQIVGSIVFTLAYEKRGELAAPVIIHCLGNLALFSISMIPGELAGLVSVIL